MTPRTAKRARIDFSGPLTVRDSHRLQFGYWSPGRYTGVDTLPAILWVPQAGIQMFRPPYLLFPVCVTTRFENASRSRRTAGAGVASVHAIVKPRTVGSVLVFPHR